MNSIYKTFINYILEPFVINLYICNNINNGYSFNRYYVLFVIRTFSKKMIRMCIQTNYKIFSRYRIL